jgi:hypothetical protein
MPAVVLSIGPHLGHLPWVCHCHGSNHFPIPHMPVTFWLHGRNYVSGHLSTMTSLHSKRRVEWGLHTDDASKLVFCHMVHANVLLFPPAR